MNSHEPDIAWRDEIDSLAFQPSSHEGRCVVHRLAFRALLGATATPEECIDYFRAHRSTFEVAAAAKITRKELPRDANFHLNSRDVRRTGKIRDTAASNSSPLQ